MPIEVVDVELEKLRTLYQKTMHAIQSGIAALMSIGDTLATPKHLRVGVDSAHVSIAALVNLLIAKGVFTNQEYVEQLAKEAQTEKERLEGVLSQMLGKKITLE